MRMSEDNARALLTIVEQRRMHWSTTITTLIGFVVVMNVGVLGYFIGAYIRDGGARPAFLLVGAAISAFIIGVWRLYTRYIDNNIANLYPELFIYERALSIPEEAGIVGYLVRNVKLVDKILLSETLKDEQKAEALNTLVKSKRIGYRGHRWIDVFGVSWTCVMLILSLAGLWIVRNSLGLNMNTILYSTCLAGEGVGFFLAVYALRHYQKDPSQEEISEVLRKLN